MRIVVVGPGAMGCLFAGRLLESGQKDVWLFDRNKERSREISKNGLRIEGVGGTRLIKGVRSTTDPKKLGYPAVDLLLICVKSYDTAEAVRSTLPSVASDTIVLTLQNGLTNIETISQVVGREKIIVGVTSHGATMVGTGHVRHAGVGETVVGKLSSITSSRVERIADLFKSAGFQTTVSSNIYSSIWGKLVVNAAINPLTAITRLRNGQLLEHEEIRRLLSMVSEEAASVARAQNIPLPYESATSHVEAICRATSSNVSSMLQDILRGKRTEIDAINGAIASEAEKVGLRTPINMTLTYLVKGIEGRTISLE